MLCLCVRERVFVWGGGSEFVYDSMECWKVDWQHAILNPTKLFLGAFKWHSGLLALLTPNLSIFDLSDMSDDSAYFYDHMFPGDVSDTRVKGQQQSTFFLIIKT